jgi:hypothetical protein
MKKIAILGSSPLMLMLAIHFSKKNKVTVFEELDTIGGAWKNFSDFIIPRYSNVVVPLNKREEKFIPKLNKICKKFFIKIKKTQKEILVNYRNNSRYKYKYDFNGLYEFSRKNLNFIKKYIYRIEQLEDDKIILNSNLNYIFDKVYVPSFIGVKEFRIKNKIYKLDYKTINSVHIQILAKKTKLKNFYYSDFFDKNLDRVKNEVHKDFSYIIARLTKLNKKLPIRKIRNIINPLVLKEDILSLRKSTFKNYYRNKQQLEKFKKVTKSTNLAYINTTSFMTGLLNLTWLK